ncbi:hypothetical protein JF535_07355 [Microbulbifer salipaludis]|uniref:Uncharacterized protein n=1 Tax=Microbulbifer salipaludis TaxID=187980 RepID=A0ABS3E6C5_9GAMM|nr:REJ domain-containing protein [Microbulbifer salipaludis]MBN8430664.1 hypothetical protein [Microbulbifer salipaludis]
MIKKTLAIVASAAVIAGCDNDSKSRQTIEIPNTAPVVEVAPTEAATPGSVVSISAVVTDAEDNVTSILWAQTGGATVELNGSESETLEFVAPGLSEASTLTFNVTVQDEDGESDTAAVTVEVLPNAAPTVSIAAVEPAATQQTVTLIATGADDYSEELTYSWKQVDAEEGFDVTLATEANEATFVAPATKFNKTLTFEVTATDDFDASSQATAEAKVIGDIHAQIKALTDFVATSDFANVYVGGFLVNDSAMGNGLFKWKRTDSGAAKNITAPIAHFLHRAGYEEIAELAFEDMYQRTSADPTSNSNFASADLGVFLYAHEVTGKEKFLEVAEAMWSQVQAKYGHTGTNPPRDNYASYPSLWGYDSYNQLMGAYLADKNGLEGADTYFAAFSAWYEEELPGQLATNPSNAIYTNLIYKEFGLGIRDETYTLTAEDPEFGMQTAAYALLSQTIDKETAVDFLMDRLSNKTDDDYSEPVAEAIGALRTFADE